MKPVGRDTRPDDAARAGPGVHQHVIDGRARRALLGVGWSALNNGSAMVIAIIVFVITSRVLPPEDFGIVALAVSIISLIASVTPGGFGEAIIQRAEITGHHLDTVFWLCIASGAALCVPIILLAHQIAEMSGEPVLALLLPFFCLKLMLDLAAVVPQALVVRSMQFKYVAARTAIGNSAGGLICILMALNGYGLWALAMAPMTQSVVSLIILVRAARWRPGFHPRTGALRELFRFGVFASGNNALNFINLDRLVLGFLAGPAVLGLYFMGRRIHDLLIGLTAGAIHPVTSVFFASIQKEHGKHVGAFSNALRATTLVAFPVFAGLFVLADNAVPLIFGSNWVPALPAVQGFAIIGFFGGFLVPSAALASGLGHAGLWFGVGVLRNLLTVVAVLLCVDGGLDSVMIGLVVVNAAMLPGFFLVARKLTGISLVQYLSALALPLVASAAMCAAMVMLPLVLPELRPWPLLALETLLGAVVYVVIALSMSRSHLAEIRQVFTREAARE